MLEAFDSFTTTNLAPCTTVNFIQLCRTCWGAWSLRHPQVTNRRPVRSSVMDYYLDGNIERAGVVATCLARHRRRVMVTGISSTSMMIDAHIKAAVGMLWLSNGHSQPPAPSRTQNVSTVGPPLFVRPRGGQGDAQG